MIALAGRTTFERQARRPLRAAVVDYAAGNLFSVVQACRFAGLATEITRSAGDILGADVVLLPGVGAFGEAIASLNRLDLVSPLKEYVKGGGFLVGICLGMQLLLSESHEFGRHAGLDLIPGDVRRLPATPDRRVPHVGWRPIVPPGGERGWRHASVADARVGDHVYFVHSYYVTPQDRAVVVSETEFGDFSFCSSLATDGVWAFQFHPEKSGPVGLRIYRRIAHEAGRRICNRERTHAA